MLFAAGRTNAALQLLLGGLTEWTEQPTTHGDDQSEFASHFYSSTSKLWGTRCCVAGHLIKNPFTAPLFISIRELWRPVRVFRPKKLPEVFFHRRQENSFQTLFPSELKNVSFVFKLIKRVNRRLNFQFITGGGLRMDKGRSRLLIANSHRNIIGPTAAGTIRRGIKAAES